MADVRVQLPIKIVDPTDNTRAAAVDAASNLQVILGANDGVDVGDVDVTSVIPGFGATNLGKREDDIHASLDTGVMMLGVRDDTPSVILSDATGDYEPLHLDANGALYCILNANAGTTIGDVNVIDVITGVGATNLGKAEDAGHTTGDTGVMALAVRQDTTLATLSTTTLDYEPLHINEVGALYVGGYAPTALGKREDDAHLSLDVGIMALAIRDDTPSAAVSGATGDYEPLHVDANGALYTILNANGGVTIGDVNVIDVIPGVTATALGKAEDAAHSSGDTGVMALVVRQATATDLSADTADNDYVPLQVDASGRLHVTDPNAGAGTPADEVLHIDTAAAVAAGTEDLTIQTADLGGTTRKLAGIDLTASVAFKVIIVQVDNDVDTDRVVLFGQSGETIQWRPVHRDYFEVVFAANMGFDGWRAQFTNMDTSEAADLYATFYTES